jgi:hypothetical protein
LSHEPKILWHYHPGNGPVLGLALHSGHEIRTELLPYLAIDEAARTREEDPYTDYWTLACPHQIMPRRSRFEVDLNRPPDEAVCVRPSDCWNLELWNERLSGSLIEHSLAEHAAFYRMLHDVLSELDRLRTHNQNMTVAARAMVDKNMPSRRPLSVSARRTDARNVSGPQPILGAIDLIAAD